MRRDSALRDMTDFSMFYSHFIKQAGDSFRTFYSQGQNSLVTKQNIFPRSLDSYPNAVSTEKKLITF